MNCTQDYSNEFEELNIFMTTERKREGIVVFLKSHPYTYNMRAHKCIRAYTHSVCSYQANVPKLSQLNTD